MAKNRLVFLVKKIVKQAEELKDKYTSQKRIPVNYACIFSHSDKEYNELTKEAEKLGFVIKETSTGPLYQVKPIETSAGKLKLLKVRKPYKNRPERGDADFTLPNYLEFKSKNLSKSEFNLIKRDEFEMMELADPKFDVLAYFSYPTLDEQLGIK